MAICLFGSTLKRSEKYKLYDEIVMKITHIIIGLNVGGAELMLKRLVLRSQSKGTFQHEVISLMDLGAIGKDLQEQGITVHTLNMSSILSSPVVSLRLYKLLKKIQPDVVQTWMYHSDLIGGLVAKSLGIKSIIWGIRTTDVSQGASKLTVHLSKLCAKLSYYIPTTIICAAHVSKDYHVGIGYDESKMKVIPNGFDLDSFIAMPGQRKILRDECGFTDKEMIVGSVGRFNQVKNQKLFVEAAALIVLENPEVRFLMIGRDNTWENMKLVSWIEQHNLRDRFVLLGERSDVPLCLAAMDVFCLHSKTEGFPNVLGEAMAMGLPCVTTDVGDAKLLLGSTGVVVSVSALSVCQAVSHLLNLDKQDLIDMGACARQRLEDNYSLSKIILQYNDVYKSLITK